jgi:2-polyprenyl-3-methyl-5-hydroxy-6-metoxy-1,4-benzoquinol methylase
MADRKFRPHTAVALLAACLLLTAYGSVAAHPKDKERWDGKYDTKDFIFGKEPIPFLRDNLHLLPKGKVLDLAMGEGRNGVFLAEQGFDVEGWDISETGLKKAHQLAAEHKTAIKTRVVDLDHAKPDKGAYDIVLCAYYMQRDLFPAMKDAVKSGGLVVVETYNLDFLKYNPRFREEWALKTNELLDIFKDFKILRYQVYDDGVEAYSSIIAQKP